MKKKKEKLDWQKSLQDWEKLNNLRPKYIPSEKETQEYLKCPNRQIQIIENSINLLKNLEKKVFENEK